MSTQVTSVLDVSRGSAKNMTSGSCIIAAQFRLVPDSHGNRLTLKHPVSPEECNPRVGHHDRSYIARLEEAGSQPSKVYSVGAIC